MAHPEHEIRLRSSARTNQGRVRQNNEDSVHLWSEDHIVLAIVADGMGGAAAGEEASRIAVETIHKFMADAEHRRIDSYDEVDADLLLDKLRDSIVQANLNIVDKANTYPEFKGMGTTVTLVFARHTEVSIAHVGDSRAYLIDKDSRHIEQVTSDHSFVQALVDAGHITAEEAEHHPMKNVLYRALGQAEEIDVDLNADVRLHVGDRMVLCSDGLTLHVDADEIAHIVSEEDDPNRASERLINLANERGGRDNISVIVIMVESTAEKPLQEAEAQAQISEDDTAATNWDDEATVPISQTDSKSNPSQKESAQSVSGSSRQKLKQPDVYGEGVDSREPHQ